MQEITEQAERTATEAILNFWDSMHCQSAQFFVDGQALLPEEAALRTVREDGVYMADYVYDRRGRITQVCYDRVKP